MSDKLLARVMALATADEQAEFFNEMGRALSLVCTLEDGAEFLQLARISDKLDERGKRLIKRLSECFE